MNKICTSIEQSQKLIELGIDVNTANMDYIQFANDPKVYDCVINIYNNEHEDDWIPAWSLSALFSILPFDLIVDNRRYVFSMCKGFDKNGDTYAIKYAIFNTTFYLHLTDFYNNPVDAAFEMVVWLKESNKI